MSTSIKHEQQRETTINSLIEDARRVIEHLRRHRGSVVVSLIGIVAVTGSAGLLLGGVTVAISSLLVIAGFDLLSAMTIGFFATGIVGTTVGLLLAVTAIRSIADKLPSDFRIRA
jgi:hypothetical protein